MVVVNRCKQCRSRIVLEVHRCANSRVRIQLCHGWGTAKPIALRIVAYANEIPEPLILRRGDPGLVIVFLHDKLITDDKGRAGD